MLYGKHKSVVRRVLLFLQSCFSHKRQYIFKPCMELYLKKRRKLVSPTCLCGDPSDSRPLMVSKMWYENFCLKMSQK